MQLQNWVKMSEFKKEQAPNPQKTFLKLETDMIR
jgi:hypothetical protein